MASFKKNQIPLMFLLSLCVSATAWLYVHQILGPWTNAKDLQKGGLKAQMGDLYPRWVGARELLLHQRNPYGEEVTHEIQMAYYGHIVTPEESKQRVVDEQRFAYPIYVVFLMAPTIYMDFAQVQFWAPFLLGTLAALSVVVCVRLLDWEMPWTTTAALVLFALSSPQIIQGMRHEQLAILVAFLVVAGGWCVHSDHHGTAGALLAFSTIKPQMAALPLMWFLVWAAGNWRARWRLLLSFGATITLLIAAGQLLLSGWLGYFFAGMAAYRRYFPTTSLLRLLLGDRFGIAVSLVIVIWLLVFGWKNREASGGSRRFVEVLAAFLMVTVIAFPLFTPFNQALLILPALLVVREWADTPKLSRLTFIAMMFWPWITSVAILLLKPSLSPESRVPLIPALVASAVPLLLPVLLSTGRTSAVPVDGPD